MPLQPETQEPETSCCALKVNNAGMAASGDLQDSLLVGALRVIEALLAARQP